MSTGASPVVSIDTPEFRALMCEFKQAGQTVAQGQLSPAEMKFVELIAHIDAAMAQHGQERYEVGWKNLQAAMEPEFDFLHTRAEAAEASLARLVEGVEKATKAMYEILPADPADVPENSRELWYLHADLKALLPAKAEAQDCAKCDGHGATHYPDGEWKGKCKDCKGTGIATPAPAMGEELPVQQGGPLDFAHPLSLQMQDGFGKRWAHPMNYSDLRVAEHAARREGYWAGWQDCARACMALRQPGAAWVSDLSAAARRYLNAVNESSDVEIEFVNVAAHTEYDRARAALQKALAASPATAPVSQPALPQPALSDAVLAEFNRLRAIPKMPGFCNGTKYTQQEAMAMAIAAVSQPAAQERHPDDAAVDRFAQAMKEKMAASRAKGRGGWDDEAQCTTGTLARMLVEHVSKGDPVDIANFAMMLHQREAAALEHHPCYGGMAAKAIKVYAPQPITAPAGSEQEGVCAKCGDVLPPGKYCKGAGCPLNPALAAQQKNGAAK